LSQPCAGREIKPLAKAKKEIIRGNGLIASFFAVGMERIRTSEGILLSSTDNPEYRISASESFVLDPYRAPPLRIANLASTPEGEG